MLRFAEEILLLALDDETGRLHPLPPKALELALAGALLFELSFQDRLDTDLSSLRVMDWNPTGDALLDRALAALRAERGLLSLQQSLARVALVTPELIEPLIQSLETKGILTRREKRILWKVQEVTHPEKDSGEESAVRERIRRVVLEDQMPEPRDVVIIALVEACQLQRIVFTPAELEKCHSRLQEIAKMESLGASLITSIRKIENLSLREAAEGKEKG
jgi:hypothetical protein